MAAALDLNAAVPRVELVTIGTELLLGEVTDENAAWLGRRLTALGVEVACVTTVGDDEAAIRAAVGAALDRTGFVLCTGGLGPTVDDRTREAVAALYGWPLRRDDAVLHTLRARLDRYEVPMTEGNARQAEVPEGASVLPNANGTAPGLVLEAERGTTVLLPGVPGEMHALFETHVVPLLSARGAGAVAIRARTLRTSGIAESTLAELLRGVETEIVPVDLAFLPGPEGVDLRISERAELSGSGAPQRRGGAEATPGLDATERVIRARAGRWIYGTDDDDLAAILGIRLREAGLSIAVAESCTGGLLGKRLTDAPGASDFFVAGFTTYADEAKTRMLGVSRDALREHGAVSGPVAAGMARAARRRARVDVAISITGIAGPGGGTAGKPVGTTWIGLSMRGRTAARAHVFPGDRAEIRMRATQAALFWAWSRLREPEGGWR